MSDLLKAARAALPGLKWDGDSQACEASIVKFFRVELRQLNDGCVESAMLSIAGASTYGAFTVKATANAAAKWLRAQVEARRDALTAALGDAPQSVEPIDDPLDLPMPGPDCTATKHIPGCRHATKDDCAAAECEHGGRRDCVFGEPLHYHHDGCPAGYSEGIEPCDREELLARMGNGWVPVSERLPDVDKPVPLWTDKGLRIGSRGFVYDCEWLWADEYGELEPFADVVVLSWLDLQPPKGEGK